MSIPQLVGLRCVSCQRTIDAIGEGLFCDDCGNPVHRNCLGLAPGSETAGNCAVCGGDPNAPLAREVMAAQLEKPHPPGMPLQISLVCPKCGHAEFKTRRPQRLIAFTHDRMCKACGRIYSPPTPIWAGLVFILVGLVMVGIGLLSLHTTQIDPCVTVGTLAIGGLGVGAFLHGIRTLIAPGKV